MQQQASQAQTRKFLIPRCCHLVVCLPLLLPIPGPQPVWTGSRDIRYSLGLKLSLASAFAPVCVGSSFSPSRYLQPLSLRAIWCSAFSATRGSPRVGQGGEWFVLDRK